MSEKILYDSPDAAKLVTREGWLSHNGQFFSGTGKHSEHSARWSGCTHMVCECGNERKKNWTKCDSCREKSRTNRYNEMEYKPWNGDPPLYSDSHEMYFLDLDEIQEYCYDRGYDSGDLDLIICEPNYANPVEDYWYDMLPDDQYLEDVAPELDRLVEELNQYIMDKKPILSWKPGKYRTSVELEIK